MRGTPPTRSAVRHRRPLLALALVTLLFGAAACSSDDDGGTSATASPTAGDDSGTGDTGTDEVAVAEVVQLCEDVPEPAAGPVNRGGVVNMIDFEFCQEDLAVETGEAVEFVSNGAVRHQVVHQPENDDDRAFQSGTLNTGDSFLHQFDTPGTYTYLCAFHPGEMVGVITVED